MNDLQANVIFAKARTALEANRPEEAESLCREILGKRRKHVDALALLGHLAHLRHDFDEAETCLLKCVKLAPKQPSYRRQLALLYTELGRLGDAMTQYDRMLRLRRRDPAAVAGKAYILEKRGELESARSLLEPFVTAEEETPEMAVTFATLLVRAGDLAEAVAFVIRALERDDLHPLQRVDLLHQLGRAHERGGSVDAAFAAYEQSNAVIPIELDPDRPGRETAELIEIFTTENVGRLPRAHGDTALPVFIAGMPRSGTTLLDRILDAHPRATGLGETDIVERVTTHLAFDINSTLLYPQCVLDLEQADVDRVSGALLATFRSRAGAVERAADKSISNARQLGLISMLFPQASVIHIVRDPLDTCFSCYVEPLHKGAHPYTADLRTLGRVCRAHERLMRHWRDVLDLRLLEVRYEDLVNDPEPNIRRIIEFCGLDWHDACLRFHETAGHALTLSYEQVRRPVYASSVGRARRFIGHLGPLIEALDEDEP